MTTVQEYYDQCYSDYKLIWHTDRNLGFHYGYYDNAQKSHDQAVLRMNEVLASKAEITEADRVLDAGCGIGGSAIWLAKSRGCRVAGINIDEEQIEVARRLLEERRLNKLVELYNMDFSNTGFPDSCFDVVWALESSCYARDKFDFLTEARRLLKVNGRLVVADGFVAEDGIHKNVVKWLDGWAVPNLASVSQFQNYLSRLNFESVAFEDITERVIPSSKRMYMACVTLLPLGKLLELLTVRTKVRTANIKSGIYQHRTLVKGLWKYGIFTAIANKYESGT